MYNYRMNLEEIKNKKILLFGKPRAFSEEEFLSQLKQLQSELVQEYNEDLAFVVDGRMMTPYEQIKSDVLYEEQGVQAVSIDILERVLAENINENSLLMSLKLSHDKERLKSFIQNTMIPDALFFRLIKMYDWQGEDFFENDDNRDVSAAFIGRFYENIERNHNVQYATTGFMHLVAQAKNSTLLEAIASLAPLSFHSKIKTAIAMNPYLDAAVQKKFARVGGEQILEALSLNVNLDKELVESFLNDTLLQGNVVRFVKLDSTLFQSFLGNYKEVALNETLTLAMQEALLVLNDTTTNLFLSQNTKLELQVLEKLLANADEPLALALYENSATPQTILTQAYENPCYHEALAKNENTPVEILYQLQLDSRYERYVKTNAGFGKHIQSENIGWMV